MTWIGQYILDERGQPQPCPNTMQWGKWMETADRHVALTDLGARGCVSTVFLGLDHNFSLMQYDPRNHPRNHRQPILWETIVFGGLYDKEMRRYSSREAAQRGHEEMVRMCMEIEVNNG